MVFLNIIMLLNIFSAGPSLILSIFTKSDWVNNKNASPSICCKEKKKETFKTFYDVFRY